MKKIAFILSLLVVVAFISYQMNADDIAVFSTISDTDPTTADNTLNPQEASSDSQDTDTLEPNSEPAIETITPTHTPAPTSTPEPTSTPVPSASPASATTFGPASKQLNTPAAKPQPTAAEPPVISISREEALSIIPPEYQQLSYFNHEYAARYVGYKELNPDMDYEKVITYVNIGLDFPFYSNISTITDTNRIDILVNKYNKLPDNFVPQLEQLPASICAPGTGNHYLRKEAKEAFEKMHNDAKKLGLNITAFSTYRSIELQNSIWNNKVKSGRTVADVDRLNARGGHSEHNTGLAIDVIKNNYTVENTAEYKWYKDNAHLYGFIIRYPNGKESITGYAYEPWHLRYIGPELATEVYNSGLTYEEYYVKMLGH